MALSRPPLERLSSLPPGGIRKGTPPALAYSCILSQACNQLIWDAISFFFLNPNKPKPIIFPQQEQQDGGFPAPSLALGVAPAPSVMVGGER